MLILDGASYHKSKSFKEILEFYGIKVIFLPPYSPYLNPIELDFNTVKQYVRRHMHVARRRPLYVLSTVLTELLDVDVTNYMQSVGYFDFIQNC